jgi:hypothetical protein
MTVGAHGGSALRLALVLGLQDQLHVLPLALPMGLRLFIVEVVDFTSLAPDDAEELCGFEPRFGVRDPRQQGI